MNTTFNSALKQSTSIRRDLSSLSSQPLATAASTDSPSSSSSPANVLSPAALGSLSASLTAFQRTIDEYNSLAKQELNPAKQEKAFERIRNFRTELAEYRRGFETVKNAREEVLHSQNRSELLGRRPYANDTPENPYANSTGASSAFGGGGHVRNTSGGGGGGGGFGVGGDDVAREEHALREQNFFAGANSALDEYIARGQAVLGDLGTQRDMLKNTQKRLYSVGNTLGVSGDTIRMIERRAREDKWIFWAGVVIFFLFCWLVLHFLR
ncbi:V-snare-domain-containing protein [Cryphonectria parasitica EP155]|uniref:Protein transport protein BOS1 n=1 Tax=Cryphonectria parasitica (strain ATCC 38755 / EP155) TaxID=660469 RepID=A0A9P4Y7K0_CRYP1|nr:V-snare-domain-containing protein [Cryphonectria parasitica EP155]KAF3767935.1 V-snare-domain-containing protein [Cryphonectria parasitica EP155]